MNKHKSIFAVTLLIFAVSALFCDGIGSDAAFPKIQKIMQTINIPQNTVYTLSDSEAEQLIAAAADIKINIFELFDCVYRYLSKSGLRIEIRGSSLQRLMGDFDYGEERILALIPIPKIIKIHTGAAFEKGQKPLQIYLDGIYENYIEIGTAIYQTEFGFNKIEPNLFSDSYGMTVKKFGIKRPIKKIHLYENGKGAIYAAGFFKPKRWRLWLITRIPKN